MTWLTTFYLRAFAILLQVALIATDEEGNGKPKIIQPPQDMNIVAENATITCISSGSTPRTTTWQKDDRTLSINAFNHLRQSSDGSLHILLARRERDTGRYKCIVSNSVGTVFSREAHITFPYMDKFSTPDSQVFSDEGSREILRCHAPKSSPDRHIYWSKINPEQPNNPHFLHAVVADKHYYQSVDGDVYFSFTTSDDSAGYYCNVENQYMGKVLRRIVSLSVTPIGTLTNTPPKVWYLTRGRRAVKGEKFVLECIASGRPVPKSIKLYKADSSNELGSKSGNGQRHVFDRFQLSDVGQYVCDVMNDYGEKDRKTTFIGVDVKPEWRTIPTDTTAEIDGSATLWCNAIGVPEVTYEWYYNGNPLPNRRAFSVSGGNLTITSIQSHLSGMYQCVAKK